MEIHKAKGATLQIVMLLSDFNLKNREHERVNCCDNQKFIGAGHSKQTVVYL